MATLTKANSDNFLTWRKVNGTLPLARLQSQGLPSNEGGFDLSTTDFVQSLVLTADDSNPRSLYWDSLGKYFYFIGGLSDKVYRKTVSTPWDISTVTSTTSKLITEDTSIMGVKFNDSGTKCLYIH